MAIRAPDGANNLWKPENAFLLIFTTRELSMRLRTTKHGLPYIALQEEGKKIYFTILAAIGK